MAPFDYVHCILGTRLTRTTNTSLYCRSFRLPSQCPCPYQFLNLNFVVRRHVLIDVGLERMPFLRASLLFVPAITPWQPSLPICLGTTLACGDALCRSGYTTDNVRVQDTNREISMSRTTMQYLVMSCPRWSREYNAHRVGPC